MSIINKYLVERHDIELRHLQEPAWLRRFFRANWITHYCYLWSALIFPFYAGRSSDDEWKRNSPVLGDRITRECRAIPGFPNVAQPVYTVVEQPDGSIKIKVGVSGPTYTMYEKLQAHQISQGRPKDQWTLTIFNHTHPDLLKQTKHTQLQIMKNLENKYIKQYEPVANIIQQNLNVGQTEKFIELFDEVE